MYCDSLHYQNLWKGYIDPHKTLLDLCQIQNISSHLFGNLKILGNNFLLCFPRKAQTGINHGLFGSLVRKPHDCYKIYLSTLL